MLNVSFLVFDCCSRNGLNTKRDRLCRQETISWHHEDKADVRTKRTGHANMNFWAVWNEWTVSRYLLHDMHSECNIVIPCHFRCLNDPDECRHDMNKYFFGESIRVRSTLQNLKLIYNSFGLSFRRKHAWMNCDTIILKSELTLAWRWKSPRISKFGTFLEEKFL